MLPAHFMVGGNFSLRTFRMPAEISCKFGRCRRVKHEFHPEDDPVFAALEDALAIAEIALRVVERAYAGAIEEADRRDAFRDGMPVRAGVAIDRGAHPAWDARERFQAPETSSVGEIHEVLKYGPRPGGDPRAIGLQRVLGIAQHQAAETLVGNDQVGAAAGDADLGAALPRGFHCRDERLLVARFGKEIGRSADAESGIAGQRSVGGNS